MNSPYGRVRRFEIKEMPELAYVIGVKFGDATQSKNWHHNYMIKLLVTDREFADEFARSISVILRSRTPRVWWYEKRKAWYTEVNSIMLYKFLKMPLEDIRQHVEHCRKCVAAFLRGFFDSEGSSSGEMISATNTNLALLRYVIFLLRFQFGIKTNSPREKGPPPGTSIVIKGGHYHVTKQCYIISVRREYHRMFARLIGFTIRRKQRGINLG